MNLKKLTWKKVGKGVGSVVNNKYTKLAAAGALGATGFGAPAAAAIIGGMSAGGKLAEGKRLTTALKGGVVDGGLTYVGGKIAGKVMPKIGGMFGRGGEGVVDEFGLPSGDIASAADPSRFRSIASTAGKFLGGKDGFGMDDVLKYGKAAGDAFGAYDQHQTVDQHRKLVDSEYAANAPLRDAARRMLMEDSQPMQPMDAVADPRYRRVTVGGRIA